MGGQRPFESFPKIIEFGPDSHPLGEGESGGVGENGYEPVGGGGDRW